MISLYQLNKSYKLDTVKSFLQDYIALSKQFQSIFRLHQQICPLECSTPMKRLETREVISLARQKRRGSRFCREYSRTTTSSIMLLVVHKSSISPTPSPLRLFSFYPLIVFAFIPRALDDDQICDQICEQTRMVYLDGCASSSC